MQTIKNDNVGVFKIAATYIGTVVGAGFATGQEVLQFFSTFGLSGLFGIILTTFLFFFFGYIILLIGRHLNAKSHLEVIHYANGKIIGTIVDIIITIFLFGALAAMIAGAGAIFDEQFQFSPIIGTIIMAIISFITVITGIKGVINAISYVVPFLLLSVLLICLYAIFTNPLTNEEIAFGKELVGATPYWFLSSLNYASYNLIISVAVLAPLGTKARSEKALFKGALLGALGLGIGIIAIYYSILTNLKDVYEHEVPMIEIAKNISVFIQIAFSIVLFAEVYTTAVGSLYGFVSRMSFIKKNYHNLIVGSTTFLAFLVAQIGFSSMVRYLYPAVGYGGLLMFLGLTYIWFFKRHEIKENR